MPDRTNLPKWAQANLARLEADMKYWQDKATAGPADSDTFVDGGFGSPSTPLGRRPNITFYLVGGPGDPGQFSNRFDVMLTSRGELQVSAGDGLVVQPWASNVVRIRKDG